MAESNGQGDVAIETGYLREFAGQDYGPELSGITGGASTQGQGGNLPQSKAFFQVEGVARTQLVTFMTQVSEGMNGYKGAVSSIAGIYEETEGRAVNTMNSVLPFDQNAGTAKTPS
jgi:hypothetical protein